MGKSTLTSNQYKLLGPLSENSYITNRFFLTGGTALSEFYFRHRFSEDLDLFSEEEFDSKKIISWASKISNDLKLFEVKQQNLSGQNMFYFYFDKQHSVKVDFAYFPFPHLGEFKKYGKLRISSIDDMAVNKVQAIITRKRSRDYLDLYLCMRKLKWEPENLLKNYRLKFDVFVSHEQLATSFVNVIDAYDLPIFLGDISWSDVQKYFLSQAKKLKAKILK